MSAEVKQPPFKPGEHALLPVIIKETDFRELKVRAERSGREFYAFSQDLHPAPREGEYRLTAEEIIDLMDDVEDYMKQFKYYDYDAFECKRDFIEKWLSEHGKEGA